MKMAKNSRRIAAIVFSLALLCGVVAGTNLFVSANETEVTKYAVDFRDLATVATNAGKDVSAGYAATAEDTAINDWVNARFGGLHSWDNGTHQTMSCIGVPYNEYAKYWTITENGLKGSDKGGFHTAYGAALTLKQDNEYLMLKNFEASLVFNTDDYAAGNVFISFHEPAAGNVGVHNGSFVPTGDMALVATTNDCRAISDAYLDCQGIEVGVAGVSLASTGAWGSNIAAADRFYKDGAATTLGQYKDYKLNVKVVNGIAHITVTSVDGSVVYGSKTTSVSNKAGTISIGTGARPRVLKSIEVTELDNKGKAVDLGTFATKLNTPVEVDEYAVDFSDLATVATNAGKDVSAGYKATAEDTAINEWVNARFGGLHSWDYGTHQTMSCIGVPYNAYAKYWTITENGLKGSDKGGIHTAYGAALTLKQNNEYLMLKNFEASLVFNTDDYAAGNVFISFHEPAAGNVGVHSNGFVPTGDMALVATTTDCRGITGAYYDCQGIEVGAAGVSLASTGAWSANIVAADRFYKDGAATTLGQNNDYKLNVRVVNGTATITVTDMNGTVYGSKTTAVSDKAGTISIGTGARPRVLKSIKVTELDEDGIPVDLGTYANPVEDPITVNQFKADFAELAALVSDTQYGEGTTYKSVETDTAINDWVNARFGAQFCGEGHTFTDRTYLGQEITTNGRTSYWTIDKAGYIANADNQGGEMFRTVEALTIKGGDGEYAVLDNFEAKVVFKNITSAYNRGVVYVAFNEKTPGKFVWTDATAYNQHDLVTVGYCNDNAQHGVTVKGYGESAASYLYASEHLFSNPAKMSMGDDAVDNELYVKVIGNDVYVKVSDAAGNVYLEQTFANQVKGTTGTVSIGSGACTHAIKSITVTKLDEVGLPVDFVETPAEPEQADNTAVIDGDVINVKAGEGYELKAGSLIVTDSEGNKFVPERVGYRNGGNAAQYQIPAAAVGECTVAYEFIQPGDEEGYNLGFLGTSVHTEDSALRFVYRLNIDKDGKVLYNGEKVAVKEYGLLLASAAILPNAADLDIETAADSMHVHQFAWPTSGRYYDKCDDYVDIAVQVNNIPTAAANMNLHSRVYLILEDNEVVYMDAVTANYANAK